MAGRKVKGNIIENVLNYLGEANFDGNELLEHQTSDNKQNSTILEVIKFMDEIPGGFLIYRADGNEDILYANPALLKIFCCKTLKEFRELTGNSFKGVVHPKDLASVEFSIKRQIAENFDNTDYVEYRIRRKDGVVRWVEDYGHYIHSDNVGDVYYVFISDVSDEKNRRLDEAAEMLSEKERKIQNLIDKYNRERRLVNQEHLRRLEVIEGLSVNYDTILYIDLDANKVLPYRVSDHSESEFEKMYQPREYRAYVSRFIRTQVHPEDREVVAKETDISFMRRKLSESKTYFINYRIIEDDAIVHMQLRIVNVGSDNHISQVVWGARNIEEEIKRDMKQTQVLEEALSNARLANIAKNTFLSNMSHDMRTPLNAIFGYTALAKHSADENAASYLDKIDVSAKQLLSLIEKVLEASSIESSEIEINEAESDLSSILTSVYNEQNKLAKEKEIDLSLDVSKLNHTQVMCDAEKVEHVVNHIVNNAVKYTENGGKVEIVANEIQELPNGYSVYEISVEDNGIGMDEENLAHIFEPFERIRNTTDSGEFGTGLGLTIAKKYVDAMDGKIVARSVLDEGSKFIVTLNLCVQSSPVSLTETTDDLVEMLRGKKILVVDDNEINLEIETEILEDLGFATDTAMDGNFAVDKMAAASDEEYALIVMDVQMPTMDGRTATKLIRELPDKMIAQIPIIALSANAFESDKKLSMEYGMDAHLTKPVDIPVLLQTIASIMHSRKENGMK
ncbi:MAG: ATP-binding protein [Corallococcus sp.]|nr:ATP-binding protein [Corallococcus sp.]